MAVHRCSSSFGWRHAASVPAAPSWELRLVQPRRYVWRNVCQPISRASLAQLWCVVDENPLSVCRGLPCQHHKPGAAPHVGHATTQHPEGEDAASDPSGGRSVRHRVAKTHPSAVGMACLLQTRRSWSGTGAKDIVLGVFGLDIIDPPAHKAAPNEELMLFKIEVVH